MAQGVWAVLSDVHGNIEALEAVLRDAEAQGAERLVVLGDSVNYGAAPVDCFERLCTEADILLLGNHERAVLVAGGSVGMGGAAGAGVAWNREVLSMSALWNGWTADKTFPEACQHLEGDVQLVHGSPRDPVVEYVWPGHPSYYLAFNEPLDRRLAGILASRAARHCFSGHTHVPAVLLEYRHRSLLKGCPWSPRMTFMGPTTLFYVPDGEVRLEGLAGVGY